ncbi:MAG: phosphoribosylformylglycinamidine synthase subunit PurS [Candidatus Omnitrophota bacterium]|nr:MAG: phosphoribosylformylglycinamidine synthase subunit PurS [Candidatus Omnitrophota bacterium]
MFVAEIYIRLKKEVADPQGLTVKSALSSLGYRNLEEVRIGKIVNIKLEAGSKKEAEREVEEMCRRLLSNPVIEEYQFKVRRE